MPVCLDRVDGPYYYLDSTNAQHMYVGLVCLCFALAVTTDKCLMLTNGEKKAAPTSIYKLENVVVDAMEMSR